MIFLILFFILFQIQCLNTSAFRIGSSLQPTTKSPSLLQENNNKRIQHLPLYNTAVASYLDYRDYYNDDSSANAKVAVQKKKKESTTARAKSKSSASSKIKSIKNIEEMKSFFEETNDKQQLVCIAYFASWCKTCQKLKVHYNKLASSDDNNDSIRLASIQHNTKSAGTNNLSLTSSLQINAFPTIQLYYGYHKVYEISSGEKNTIKNVKEEIDNLSKLSSYELTSLSKRRDNEKVLENLIFCSSNSAFDLEEEFFDSEDIYALV